MAGHSKWHNIQARKGKQDAQRGKIFTKLGREIYVAVKQGGADPQSNSTLQAVIAKAKANNMPNDTIKNAIKKASGANNTENFEQITYEGYGISGTAIIVEAMTDNKNRTASEVRHLFSKHGGNLGVTGCVSYMFDKKGVIVLSKESTNLEEEELFEKILENDGDIEDIKSFEEIYEVLTDVKEFSKILNILESLNIEILEANIEQVPQNTVNLDEVQQEKLEKLINSLEDLDDVQNVFHNAEI
ncbi:MAG: YebC/PmpR family DNA-binding transcriptional regulator [Clostridium sp.]